MKVQLEKRRREYTEVGNREGHGGFTTFSYKHTVDGGERH